MPEISRFYGIIIYMYYEDHLPSHFHAHYGEHEAIIEIESLAVIAGSLPHRALGLVIEWASMHQKDPSAAWEDAKALQPLRKIAPLK